MTREELTKAIVEGFIKDVLTHDLSSEHPRPHQGYRFNNAARKAKEKAREVFRNKAKGKHDTQPINVSKVVSKARRAPRFKPPKGYQHTIKTSSARRPGPTIRQQRGRKAVLGTAAVIGTGIVAHKLYKRRQQKKKEMREALIERLVEYNAGNFLVSPAAAPEAISNHKEQRDRYWEIKNRKRMKSMKVEVFDDTYGAGVFGRGARAKKTADLIRKAQMLKRTKKRNVVVPQMKIYKKAWSA